MNDERIKIFDLGAIPGEDRNASAGGQFLVHYWIGSKHEAGQYEDRPGLSEIAECLGTEEAAKIRISRPGQSATWTQQKFGHLTQVLVHRIW